MVTDLDLIKVHIDDLDVETLRTLRKKSFYSVRTQMRFYKSYAYPDLTEGRGSFKLIIYFATLDPNNCGFERCLQYMINNFGNCIEYVMGASCAPTPNWTVPLMITETDFFLRPVDQNNYKERGANTHQVFLSTEEVEDMPKPIWIF